MQTPPAEPKPSAGHARFGPGLRGYGMAVRTAQSLGLEWLDHARHSRDDLLATAGRLALAPTPAAAVAIQLDYLNRSAERFAAHATACGGLLAALADDLARHSARQGFGAAWGAARGMSAPARVR